MILLILIVVFTFIYGSMIGYFIHWLLHTEISDRLTKSHDVHHKLYTVDNFESDTYRDAKKNDSAWVFIPIITVAIILACVPLLLICKVWWIYPPILIMGVLVGWLNDAIHEAFHIKSHWLNKYAWFRHLKHLHMQHHIYPKKNMGIIWFLPDRIFGTFKK